MSEAREPGFEKIDLPVKSGAEVLDDVLAFLKRFVAYPDEHAAVAHTLWVAHCHLMDQWESTPRIAFLSPEPGSGKTRALEITETLVPRPIALLTRGAGQQHDVCHRLRSGGSRAAGGIPRTRQRGGPWLRQRKAEPSI